MVQPHANPGLLSEAARIPHPRLGMRPKPLLEGRRRRMDCRPGDPALARGAFPLTGTKAPRRAGGGGAKWALPPGKESHASRGSWVFSFLPFRSPYDLQLASVAL